MDSAISNLQPSEATAPTVQSASTEPTVQSASTEPNVVPATSSNAPSVASRVAAAVSSGAASLWSSGSGAESQEQQRQKLFKPLADYNWRKEGLERKRKEEKQHSIELGCKAKILMTATWTTSMVELEEASVTLKR
jgi:hypothetical protein